MKKKHSLLDLVTPNTPEEVEKQSREWELMHKLGIPIYFDSHRSINKNKEYTDPYFEITDSQFRKINTQYTCFADYDRDKNTASILIYDDKPIPQDLYNKLVQTRIELEQAGLLPPYKE